MSDDSPPFFAGRPEDSISDLHPELQSLDVEVEITKIAGEDVGYRRYDEEDLPSHIPCPECGTDVSVGWTVEDYVDEQETDFDDRVSCPGEVFEGKSCMCIFEIEGTAKYN